MFKKLYGCILVCMVLMAGGCSLGPVKTPGIKNSPQTLLLNQKSGPVLISQTDAVSNESAAKPFTISMTGKTQLKYASLPFAVGAMPAVRVTMPNGKSYEAFVDTGFSEYVWMNDLVVAENKLSTYSLGNCSFSNAAAGVCYLPWMQLGTAMLTNPPSRYQQLHWELQMLGLPLWKQRSMLLGLKMLRQFDYVVFDNENYKMQLVSDGEFTPRDPASWSSYKFRIEPDSTNNIRLMVDLPVAGKVRNVMFDTCGGYGLVIHPAVWNQISADFAGAKLAKGKFISGFQGFLPCLKGRIDKLTVGNRTISNAQIVVPDESTTYLGSIEAMMSMAYFKDTVVVFDNIHNLMWVRNS